MRRHKQPRRTAGVLGTVKLGETVFPITHLEFRDGLLQVEAVLTGPLQGDTGRCYVFDLQGRFIISNKNPATVPTVAAGATCTVLLPISITPTYPDPLPDSWDLEGSR